MGSLAVYITPKAGRNEVSGVRVDDAGQREALVRVTAAPDGGKANKAVCETIAKALGVAKSKVKLVRGATSRHKMLEVDIDATALDVWLATLS